MRKKTVLAAGVAALMLVGTAAYALINPNFTPVHLVEKAELVLLLKIGAVDAKGIAKAEVVKALKGKADKPQVLDLTKSANAEHAKAVKEMIAANGDGPALLFVGTGEKDEPIQKLHLGGKWVSLEKAAAADTYEVDVIDSHMEATWAGGTDMLLKVVELLLKHPDTDVPVACSGGWEEPVNLGKIEGRVREAMAVDLGGKGELVLFVAGDAGDRVYAYDAKAKKFGEVTPALKLASKSAAAAAWGDFNGDGRLDLASSDGKALTLWSQAADGTYASAAVAEVPKEECVGLGALDLGVKGRAGLVWSAKSGPTLLVPDKDKAGVFALKALAAGGLEAPKTLAQSATRARRKNVATVTTPTPHGLASGQRLGISGLGGTGYNGDCVVVATPTKTAFTYANPGADEGKTAAQSAARARKENVATLTTKTPHGLVAGQMVAVSGMGGAGYDGDYVVVSAPNATTLTFANTGDNEAETADAGGTLKEGVADAGGAVKEAAGCCLVADFTGDLLPDVLQLFARRSVFYPGKGGAEFAAGTACEVALGDGRTRAFLGDFDADGRIDVHTVAEDSPRLWQNAGGGKFVNLFHISGELTYISKPGCTGGNACDINNDGRQDVFLYYPETTAAQVFFNRGYRSFGHAHKPIDLAETGNLPEAEKGQQAGVLADLNGDSAQDMALVLADGSVIVLAQTLPGDAALAVRVSLAPGGAYSGPVNVSAVNDRRPLGAWPVAPGTCEAFFGRCDSGPVTVTWQLPGGPVEKRELKLDTKPIRLVIGEEKK